MTAIRLNRLLGVGEGKKMPSTLEAPMVNWPLPMLAEACNFILSRSPAMTPGLRTPAACTPGLGIKRNRKPRLRQNRGK